MKVKQRLFFLWSMLCAVTTIIPDLINKLGLVN